MAQLDAKAVKQKILKFIGEKGPSLPVNIAKAVELNSLFTSAFLSEMAREGKIKISHMKVGGSPLYYTSEKENMLENFSSFLGNKEREAFEMLKSNKFLQDDIQNPAIRVALRSLKDFSIPLKKNDKLFWKYFTAGNLDMKPEEELEKKAEEKPKEIQIVQQAKLEEKGELEKLKKELAERDREIEQIKQDLERKRKEKKPKKAVKKKAVLDETFLNEVKQYLAEKNIELVSIEDFDKKHAVLKVKAEDKYQILFAYDKKKIAENEIISAHKKASELNLDYSILFRGELSKKSRELIEACKSMNSIGKLAEKQ